LELLQERNRSAGLLPALWGRDEFTAIPKRAFENAAHIQAFDAVLGAHVPKVERKM